MVQSVGFLRNFDLLKNVSDEHLLALARMINIMHVEKGQMLFHPGDPADTVYLLNRGLIEISHLSDTGKQLTLNMIGPGEIFGELALIMEGSHCCMAQALQDSTMYIVPKKGLLNFLQMQPALLLTLTKIIGLRRQQIESRFSDLVFQTVPCRLARVLVELLRQYPESAPQGKQIKLHLTHKDLAHLAGTSRETVSVWFSRWKKQGILNTQHGHILIYDPVALEVLTKKDHPS